MDEASSLVLASAPDHQLNQLKFPTESDYLAVRVVQKQSQSQRETSLNILPGPEKGTFHDKSPERDGEQFFTEPTLPCREAQLAWWKTNMKKFRVCSQSPTYSSLTMNLLHPCHLSRQIIPLILESLSQAKPNIGVLVFLNKNTKHMKDYGYV